MIVILILLLFFTNAKNVSESIISSLKFCITSLIPSLFSYMILSSFIVSYNPVNIGVSALFSPFNKILGICKIYTSPILLGNLSGFVTGPKLICEAYNSNDNKNDFSKAIILSSNAGVGFVISFIGINLWGDIFFGIFLYITQILASITISKIVFFNHKPNQNNTSKKIKWTSFSTAVSNSVVSSTKSIIIVSSYTILFSVIISLIYKITKIEKASVIGAFIASLLDISQGTKASLLLKSTPLCAFFTGFCVGFGGLCVIFQIFSICDGFPLNKAKFILSKLLQGTICGIITMIYSFIFPLNRISHTFMSSDSLSLSSIFFITLLFFNILNIAKSKFKC